MAVVQTQRRTLLGSTKVDRVSSFDALVDFIFMLVIKLETSTGMVVVLRCSSACGSRSREVVLRVGFASGSLVFTVMLIIKLDCSLPAFGRFRAARCGFCPVAV